MKILITLYILLFFHNFLLAEIFPFTQAAQENTPLSNINNPAYLPFADSFFGEIKYSNPYEIEELYNYSVQSGYCFENAAAALKWERFGIAAYTEDSLEIMAGLAFLKYFSIGYSAQILRLQINSEESQFKHVTSGHNLAFRFFPFKFLSLGVYQQNIYTLYKKERSDLLPAFTSAGAVISPARGIFFSWNYQHTYYGKIQTWQISTNLLPRFTIKAGYSREISTYGFSSDIYLSKIKINYTFRYHAYLGKTHLFAAAWNGKEIFLEPINYNPKKFMLKNPKLNIQKCSLEQLNKINGVNNLYTTRIIKYRELFKVVTNKSLIQLGLPPKQIKLLKKYTTGFTEEQKIRKKKFYYKRKRARTILTKNQAKNLFTKLIQAGISYNKAFNIARQAAYKKFKPLLREILQSNQFTHEEKRTIKKIWREKL